MAGAMPAYQIGYPDFALDPQTKRRPDISVVPGGRNPERERDAVHQVKTVAILAVVVILVVTCLAFSRIVLSSMTVNSALEAHNLNEQITDARSVGGTLEAEQATLLSSTRIKAAATELGMAAAEDSEVLYLGEDVVAVDAEGNLSLAMSTARAKGAGA